MRKLSILFVYIFLLNTLCAQRADSVAVVNTVDSLIKVSKSLSSQGQHEEALSLNADAEKIVLESFGHKSVAYGDVCLNYGHTFFSKVDYPNAEKWYLKSTEIFAEVLGKEDPHYAKSINDLAWLYLKTGDFKKAEMFNIEAREIRERLYGKEHPDYALSSNNLALVYWKTGNYEMAEPLFIEAKNIQEKTIGKEHADYASTLNNLALLYWELGKYEKVEPLYLEAQDIREKVFGKEHPVYAKSLNNLAVLYFNTGNYKKAEPLFLEVKGIREKTLGKEHPDYAKILNGLAILYWKLEDYGKVEPLYLEAIDIQQKTLGKDHPNYAMTLNNLGELYVAMKQYEKAEPLYQEAKDIWEKALGKEHPHYAVSLNNLATLYKLLGRFDKVEPLYLEAKDIRGNALGKEHPDYATSVYNLAKHYIERGKVTEASKLLQELGNLNQLLVERAAVYMSENEILAYQKTFDGALAEYHSFTQRYQIPDLTRESYNDALFYNGLSLENNRLLARAIAGADSLTRELYAEWQDCHRRLAKRYARPIADKKKIVEVEAEAETFEKQIIRNLPAFKQARKIPTWQDVQEQLQTGEAALEFIHYRYFKPEKSDSVVYAALLLRPGMDAPAFIPLFEEKSLDSLLLTTDVRKADYVANLYSIPDRGVIGAGKPEKTLYELLWKSLESHLSGVSKVFFAPTGLMHRLNLAAIPISPDTILADRYQLVELGSTRQLISQNDESFDKNDAILFGGIQYDMDSSAIFMANEALLHQDIVSRGITEDDFGGAFGDGTWKYLKWTEKEVDAVGNILSAGGFVQQTRKGFDATEEVFKNIGSAGPSPRVLHVATHGFFFPDPKDNPEQNGEVDENEVGFKTSNNPLIRSGLLFAGANQAWKTGKPVKKGMDNGILTAYEISHMDLSNTELVVLSACETGLGDIQGNEGVYGLQRAFKIAGVKYLIMSLWQVPDFQTKELMTTFYSKWLSENMSIPDAFHAAQQEMREKYMNPYFWAGFVLVE
ncbi:MAG: CHAT domain-containing tetratricopeptide repeat protein [Saprospiraceae bacterium]